MVIFTIRMKFWWLHKYVKLANLCTNCYLLFFYYLKCNNTNENDIFILIFYSRFFSEFHHFLLYFIVMFFDKFICIFCELIQDGLIVIFVFASLFFLLYGALSRVLGCLSYFYLYIVAVFVLCSIVWCGYYIFFALFCIESSLVDCCIFYELLLLLSSAPLREHHGVQQLSLWSKVTIICENHKQMYFLIVYCF